MINIIKKEDLLAYIQSRIYVIRGQKIMMDRDLAELNLFVPLAFRSLNRNFGFAEVTFARKNKEKQAFLWFFPRLIVTLHP